jgi:hypothetical protein
MAKVSPARTSFNGGVFSDLFLGRVDHERYSAGNRFLNNFVAVAQGPAIARSGTKFQATKYKHDKHSMLVPFVFSEDQALQLEFSDLVMRIHTEDGILVYSNEAVTQVVTVSPFKFRSAALVTAGIAVGDQVSLTDWPGASAVNGSIGNVTAVSGNDITLDLVYKGAAGAVSGPLASKVFILETPYSHQHVRNIRYLQDLDALYLFCAKSKNGVGYQPYKLTRRDATDWTLEVEEYVDGPYMPEATKGAVIEPTVSLGLATEKAGTASASATYGGYSASDAFDRNLANGWVIGAANGWIKYTFTNPQVVDGYTLYAPLITVGDTPAFSRRPKSWTFEASNDGTNWVSLDTQASYSLWSNNRTEFIKVVNTTAYEQYRVSILENEATADAVSTAVGEIAFSDKNRDDTRLTWSSIEEVNNGKGFNTNDVGRLIRVYQKDGHWRSLKITEVISTSVVDAKLQGEPLISYEGISRWRLGTFSNRTGWPTKATFAYDRLVVGGSRDFPTEVAGSKVGAYNNFQPSEPNGTVADDSGFNLRPKTRNASPLGWLSFTGRGIALGFGSGEYLIAPTTENVAFSARNAIAKPSTRRGSASMEPVLVDNEILFVSKDALTLREFAYVFQSDGYRSPSMSIFASHLGYPGIAQIEYAASPHSIVWVRRTDGSLVGFTYNREEGVLGWHTHTFGGTDVDIESISVLPSSDYRSDDLWIVVNRTIEGETRGYIEKLQPFWGFDDDVSTAWYVDSGLRAEFETATDTVYGLQHLEGLNVCGLADGISFGYDTTYTVTDGAVTLPFEATNVLIGLCFEAFGETSNIEAGAADGTAQGKVKRSHNVSVAIWSSAYGEIGVYDEDRKVYHYTPMDENIELGVPELKSRVLDPVLPEQIYNKRGSIAFRRVLPYPLNITGIYPQMHTQDR